jgi:hypothetical protein
MSLRRAVDPIRVRPYAEVSHVQHPLEAHAERLLESEDVVIEPLDGSMDVASGADDHGSSQVRTGARAGKGGEIQPRRPSFGSRKSADLPHAQDASSRIVGHYLGNAGGAGRIRRALT